MHNHQPLNYSCPICNLLNQIESVHNRVTDIVFQDDHTLAFISPKWWPNNPGHVMVVSKKHFENIYDLPLNINHAVSTTIQTLALAIKTVYGCEGISTRQHNEPAGNQDLWHFHTHVFPRWQNDRLYELNDQATFVTPEQRLPYANKLRVYFANKPFPG